MTLYHYIALGLFAAFALADTIGRRTGFPRIAFWRVMGVVSFLLYFAIATYAPFLWDSFLGSHQLIDGSALPFWRVTRRTGFSSARRGDASGCIATRT